MEVTNRLDYVSTIGDRSIVAADRGSSLFNLSRHWLLCPDTVTRSIVDLWSMISCGFEVNEDAALRKRKCRSSNVRSLFSLVTCSRRTCISLSLSLSLRHAHELFVAIMLIAAAAITLRDSTRSLSPPLSPSLSLSLGVSADRSTRICRCDARYRQR